MAEKLESEVRYFLRPSEDVNFTLETFLVRKYIEKDISQWSQDPNGKNMRVLAVVTHHEQVEEEEREEGRCVFHSAIWRCRSWHRVGLFSGLITQA